MPTYQTNEATFDVPELPFVDRSVNFLEATVGEDGETLSIVVEREPADGRTLEHLVDEHVRAARERLRGYSPLDQAERTVGDARAFEIAAKFVDEDGAAYTRSIHFIVGPLYILVACEGSWPYRTSCDQCLEHVASTLRLKI